MEKKGNRNFSNSSRGSATDLRKIQDVTSSKQWPRGTRRREPNGPGFSAKNEPSRKPQPQRVKTIDKRPKPRGFYYANSTPRDETTRLDEIEPELGSVFVPGSKKQSLNHLLNFSYAPRDSYHGYKGFGKSGSLLVTRKHKYNKEHFLQANCQFIVNELGDYKKYMSNPDSLVSWDLVEQVNLQVSENPSCPICLYPPVAAKMTKCGHIYCWSCILHYLALSDKDWRKCPICFDSVKKSDLRSVVAIPFKTFKVNETIKFKLMKRPRGSLTAYPAEVNVLSEDELFRMSDENSHNFYSKLILASKANILSIIDRESIELEVQMAEDENCPEKCFIEQAVTLLKLRRDNIVQQTCDNSVQNLVDLTLQGDQGSLEDEAVNAESGAESGEDSTSAQKFHYFYQASDGQHIYLHAINAKMIEHTYGSLEYGPTMLSGRILEKEGGSMTEELRKKLRYLQHLPVTCQFEIAEIQLTETIVTEDTLKYFSEQLENRRRRRQRRVKEEKRREKRIEAEENRKIGKFTAPNLHLESHDQFPGVSEVHVQFPEVGSEHRTRSQSETISDRSSSPDFSSPSGFSLDSCTAGPSFATMLASDKKKELPVWHTSKLPLLQAPPLKLIPVTGLKMTIPTKTHARPDSDPEPDDYEPVPSYHSSFGDALAQALAKNETNNVEVGTLVEAGKKKKKKTKQKVLFATNMACKGN
ncbi:E3 ubiquitin-protein ligase RNF10 [Cylas formicarius]|uniref:E3 ubiquitin-protein ligase RNF10 n=1 Tax=Cylas formicarius TaxID=197179 RepID=UPI0029586EBE|nr:E3 ubiquitin-protein ligase RNF10 [Cylas formicarius]